MNNKDQKNGAQGSPLIFTVPAYGFVMALYLDWLGRSNHAAFSAETFVDVAVRETFETEDPAPGSKINRVTPLGSKKLSERQEQHWGAPTKTLQ